MGVCPLTPHRWYRSAKFTILPRDDAPSDTDTSDRPARRGARMAVRNQHPAEELRLKIMCSAKRGWPAERFLKAHTEITQQMDSRSSSAAARTSCFCDGDPFLGWKKRTRLRELVESSSIRLYAQQRKKNNTRQDILATQLLIKIWSWTL